MNTYSFLTERDNNYYQRYIDADDLLEAAIKITKYLLNEYPISPSDQSEQRHREVINITLVAKQSDRKKKLKGFSYD